MQQVDSLEKLLKKHQNLCYIELNNQEFGFEDFRGRILNKIELILTYGKPANFRDNFINIIYRDKFLSFLEAHGKLEELELIKLYKHISGVDFAVTEIRTHIISIVNNIQNLKNTNDEVVENKTKKHTHQKKEITDIDDAEDLLDKQLSDYIQDLNHIKDLFDINYHELAEVLLKIRQSKKYIELNSKAILTLGTYVLRALESKKYNNKCSKLKGVISIYFDKKNIIGFLEKLIISDGVKSDDITKTVMGLVNSQGIIPIGTYEKLILKLLSLEDVNIRHILCILIYGLINSISLPILIQEQIHGKISSLIILDKNKLLGLYESLNNVGIMLTKDEFDAILLIIFTEKIYSKDKIKQAILENSIWEDQVDYEELNNILETIKQIKSYFHNYIAGILKLYMNGGINNNFELLNRIKDYLGDDIFNAVISFLAKKLIRVSNSFIDNSDSSIKDYCKLYNLYTSKEYSKGLEFIKNLNYRNTEILGYELEFLRKLKQYDLVIEKFQNLENKNLGNYICLSYAYMESGEGQKANENFKIAIELTKDNDCDLRLTRLYCGIIFNYERNNIIDTELMQLAKLRLSTIDAKSINETEKKHIIKALAIINNSRFVL